MADVIDLSDFVRIRSGRHQGKTGMVQRMTEHGNRPIDYDVLCQRMTKSTVLERMSWKKQINYPAIPFNAVR